MTSLARRPSLTDEQRAARRLFMETLVNDGLAKMGHVLTADEIAEMVCVARRTWQRIMAGDDFPPRSVIKVFCLETGLPWETYDSDRAGPYRLERAA